MHARRLPSNYCRGVALYTLLQVLRRANLFFD